MNWLNVSPRSGTIQSGGVPQTLSVSVNAANLSAGNYSATVSIQSNGGNSVVDVLLVVTISISGSCPANTTLVFQSLQNVNVPWSC